jgi:hypothetical protein
MRHPFSYSSLDYSCVVIRRTFIIASRQVFSRRRGSACVAGIVFFVSFSSLRRNFVIARQISIRRAFVASFQLLGLECVLRCRIGVCADIT